MSVHLYTITRNEEDMLGFFFRHYDPWVDRYFIYDNDSSDATREMLAAHPKVELREFPWADPDSFVESHMRMQNQVWKESRGQADWVVVTAIDEHLHLPGLPMTDYLQECSREGATIVPALAFDMFSETFPEPDELLSDARTRGVPNRRMCKLSLFSPDAVSETAFTPGRHFARPVGHIRPPKRDALLLLHYKMLDPDRVFERHHFLRESLRATDVANRFGIHYDRSRAEHDAVCAGMRTYAREVCADPRRSRALLRHERWWRLSWKLRHRLGRVRQP